MPIFGRQQFTPCWSTYISVLRYATSSYGCGLPYQAATFPSTVAGSSTNPSKNLFIASLTRGFGSPKEIDNTPRKQRVGEKH